MSNPPARYETSILFGWGNGGDPRYLQLLPDGNIAKVDEHLNVLETMTVEEAKTLKASIGEDPDGYWGTPPNAKFHLATYHPLIGMSPKKTA